MTDGLRRATLDDRSAIEAVQRAAYADTARTIGRTPIPLEWDYGRVLEDWQVWLSEDALGITGVLIVNPRAEDLYLESIAVHPRVGGTGVGRVLMAAAEAYARRLGLPTMRLLTNELNVSRIAWYERCGFAIEFTERLDGRGIVHMLKRWDHG